MITSIEAKNLMKMFTMFQKLGILSKEEEFDRYYVWMRKVGIYVREYSKF